MEISVREIGSVTPDLQESVRVLLGQLSTSGAQCTDEQLQEVVRSPSTTLFVASVGRAVAGMLTLVAVRIPTGMRAIIEDVVVEERFRGNGIGAALLSQAIAKARDMGAAKVDLTSNGARVAANRLYRQFGFQLRETNVYRLKLHSGAQPGP